MRQQRFLFTRRRADRNKAIRSFLMAATILITVLATVLASVTDAYEKCQPSPGNPAIPSSARVVSCMLRWILL